MSTTSITSTIRSRPLFHLFLSLSLWMLWGSVQNTAKLVRREVGRINVEAESNLQSLIILADKNVNKTKTSPTTTATLFFETQSTSKVSPPNITFDFLHNPTWPLEPPTIRSDCKVVFKDPNLQLCHINPYGIHGNFGDELGPPIVRRILELVFDGCTTEYLPVYDLVNLLQTGNNNNNGGGSSFLTRTRPCFLSVGSLWRMVKSGDHLWGTGVAYMETIISRCMVNKDVSNLTIYSYRGPKSAMLIRQCCDFARNDKHSKLLYSTTETAGDAGFLVPYLFPEVIIKHDTTIANDDNNSNNKTACVIPHAQEQKARIWDTVRDRTIEISVQQSWEDMVQAMQQKCNKIISSSLHGIILAEALRIPSRHVKITKQPGLFKFEDFYESLRGRIEPELMTDAEMALNNVIDPLSISEGENYAKRILKTFPIHLFDIELLK